MSRTSRLLPALALTSLVCFVAGYATGGTAFAARLNQGLSGAIGQMGQNLFGFAVIQPNPAERRQCRRVDTPVGPVWKCRAAVG
jgi:hypothetical protein